MCDSLLEVIALDAADARAARDGGADRLELVTDIEADGLTPSVRTVAEIRAACDLQLRVMLRTRPDFATGDLDALAERARTLASAGADGFVLGFIDGDSSLDVNAMRYLSAAGGLPWTCHRAIDHVRDYDAAFSGLDGLDRLDQVLTAGSPAGVESGMDNLLRRASDALLMAGGGLRLEHVPPLRAAGITAFHIGSSARDSWSDPVDPRRVERWRASIDR